MACKLQLKDKHLKVIAVDRNHFIHIFKKNVKMYRRRSLTDAVPAASRVLCGKINFLTSIREEATGHIFQHLHRLISVT